MFQLSKEELMDWISQFATSNSAAKMGLRKRPYAFTEYGAVMLASVLKSQRAVAMSIQIVRTFVRLKNALILHEKFPKEFGELKSFMLKHSHKTDREFRRVWQAIEKLSNPPQEPRRIGFDLS